MIKTILTVIGGITVAAWAFLIIWIVLAERAHRREKHERKRAELQRSIDTIKQELSGVDDATWRLFVELHRLPKTSKERP